MTDNKTLANQAKKDNSAQRMGTMPEGKLLITLSLPMMISMFVQAMYNIVDSIFVAQISQDALTAVSLAFPMQTLMIAIAGGTGVGVNAMISRYLGEKKQKRANAVAMNAIFIYLISYIVLAIGSLFVIRPFYELSTEPGQEAILELGVQYLTIVLTMSFGIFAQFVFERMLQSTGRTLFTMFSQTLGAVINLIMDPILIFGLLGFPKMGIQGAALATVMGQIIAGFTAFMYNVKKNPDIQLSLKGFRPDKKIIGEIYKIGVPSIIMQSIGSVMTTCMNIMLNGLDVTGTGAAVFGVYYKLQSFFFMPMFGLNNGLIPIVSYNYGAGNRQRMKNTMKYAYRITFGFCLFGFIGFEAVPASLLKIFSASEAMLAIGVPALRIIAVHYLIAWYCIITGSLFQCTGKAKYSMWVSVCRQLVVLVPAAYILSLIGGLDLIWWCLPISELMSLAITLVCLRKVNKHLDADPRFQNAVA